MIDKMITKLLCAKESLEKFDQKARVEVEKYNCRQIKKTAVIFFVLGILIGKVM